MPRSRGASTVGVVSAECVRPKKTFLTFFGETGRFFSWRSVYHQSFLHVEIKQRIVKTNRIF